MLHDLNNYKLICIPPELFEKIIGFTQKHDYASGNSRWHIFDSHSAMIKVYDKNGVYRSFIYAISDKYDEFSWYNSSGNVWLVWNYMNISRKELWSAQATYRWLVEDLIPAVELYFKETNSSIFRRTKDNIQISRLVYTNNDKYYDITKKVSASILFNIGSSLQLMYSMEKQVYMEWFDYLNIYNSILYLVEICLMPDYYYINSKLGLDETDTKEDLWRKINQLKENESEGRLNSGKLDMLFRVFSSLVQDSLEVITEEEISKVVILIKEPINLYNTIKLVESQYKV